MDAARKTSVALAGTLLAVSLAACQSDPRSSPEPGDQQPPTAADVTTADGLTIERNGVVVNVPAGAVPEGTPVVLTARGDDAPAVELPTPPAGFGTAPTAAQDLSGVVAPAGPGYDLVLGDDLQPTVPLTFTVPVSGSPARDGSTAWALVLEDDAGVDMVPATYDETTGTVTGEVPHLSGIWPVQLDLGPVVQAVGEVVKVTYPEPGCAGDTAQVGGATYSVTAGSGAWMCVDAPDEELEVTASPSTAIPYLVTSNRPAAQRPTVQEVTLSTVVVRAVVDRFYAYSSDDFVMFPGSDVILGFEQAPRGLRLAFEQAPVVFLLQILAAVLDVVTGGIDNKTLERIGQLECLANLKPATITGGLTVAGITAAYNSFFDCVGPVVEQYGKLPGPQRVLLGIVSAAPSLLVGQIVGLLNEITGQSRFTVPVDRSTPRVAVDQSSSALVGTWRGTIDQGFSTYTAVVTIGVDPSGNLTGLTRYPELGNCRGLLSDIVVEGGELVATENIEHRPDRCVDLGTIRLTPDSGTLLYDWEDGEATGVLTRPPVLTAGSVAPFLGTWVGDIDQIGSRPYSVRMTLTVDGAGAVSGTTVYPELGRCRAVLEDARLVGDTLVVEERVTYVGNTCGDTTLELTPVGDQLAYAFDVNGTGSSTLTRIP